MKWLTRALQRSWAINAFGSNLFEIDRNRSNIHHDIKSIFSHNILQNLKLPELVINKIVAVGFSTRQIWKRPTPSVARLCVWIGNAAPKINWFSVRISYDESFSHRLNETSQNRLNCSTYFPQNKRSDRSGIDEHRFQTHMVESHYPWFRLGAVCDYLSTVEKLANKQTGTNLVKFCDRNLGYWLFSYLQNPFYNDSSSVVCLYRCFRFKNRFFVDFLVIFGRNELF